MRGPRGLQLQPPGLRFGPEALVDLRPPLSPRQHRAAKQLLRMQQAFLRMQQAFPCPWVHQAKDSA